jgi:hypothetical protein
MDLHICGLTHNEIKLLEKLLDLVERGFKENLAEKAAIELRISPTTVRTRFYRLRNKYSSAKEFTKTYRGWQQKLFQKTGGKFRSL